MKRSVILGTVAVIILVGLGYFSMSGRGGDNQKAPIRIAFNTWIGYSSFYIAEEKRFFEKHGTAVETRVIEDLDYDRKRCTCGSFAGFQLYVCPKRS